MAHDTPLITAIVMGLCLAFLFGAIANRLRISPLVGYLLAGVVVGPNTPGFYADSALTEQLAEIGVILLMFGVGLHFSMKDLLSVKKIAVPGAIAQIAAATLLGMGFGLLMGWGVQGGFVFGLALSTASTVVLLRAMQERRLIETERGRIAVGWLIVEDMAMVLALVLLPALAPVPEAAATEDAVASWLHLGLGGMIALTIAKVALFVVVMMVFGRRVIPWLLKIIAQTGSRELFSLAVLAIALGVAFGASHLFGVSLALGAFFAGMIMSESELSQRAAEETLPLRDAFAVLFFVSVGMLFNPQKLLTDFVPLFITLVIIIIGKSAVAFFIVRAFRHPVGTALTISASLAQIGEFSFILASLGHQYHMINDNARDLILGGAILSILLNPLVFSLAAKLKTRLERPMQDDKTGETVSEVSAQELEDEEITSSQREHIVLAGYGRIGQRIAAALKRDALPVVIIEETMRYVDKAREEGFETILGNAGEDDRLAAANITAARIFVVAFENTFEVGRAITLARKSNSSLLIIARAPSDSESQYLLDLGANIVVTDEQEIAHGMIGQLLRRSGLAERKNAPLLPFLPPQADNPNSEKPEQ